MYQVNSAKETPCLKVFKEQRRRRVGSPGQASVEFALVLPVLLIMTVAVCQVAFALNCYLVVTAASREGARRGAETNDAETARKAVSSAASALPGQKPQVDVSFPEGRSKGSPIRVTVTYHMPFLIPGLEHLIPQAKLSMSTSMALERGDY
jgi:TadE-like protein